MKVFVVLFALVAASLAGPIENAEKVGCSKADEAPCKAINEDYTCHELLNPIKIKEADFAGICVPTKCELGEDCPPFGSPLNGLISGNCDEEKKVCDYSLAIALADVQDEEPEDAPVPPPTAAPSTDKPE